MMGGDNYYLIRATNTSILSTNPQLHDLADNLRDIIRQKIVDSNKNS